MFLFPPALGVVITHVRVPPLVQAGDKVVLECDWKIDAEIYALKWYFGLREFYRWTPADENKVMVRIVIIKSLLNERRHAI